MELPTTMFSSGFYMAYPFNRNGCVGVFAQNLVGTNYHNKFDLFQYT